MTLHNGAAPLYFAFHGIAFGCSGLQGRITKVTTINFDRNYIRSELGKLHKKSDEVSGKLDLCTVTAQVDYEPPFDVNSSFADAFETFTEAAGA